MDRRADKPTAATGQDCCAGAEGEDKLSDGSNPCPADSCPDPPRLVA